MKIMTSTLNTLKSNSGSRKKKLRKGRGIAAGQGASCGFGMRGQSDVQADLHFLVLKVAKCRYIEEFQN